MLTLVLSESEEALDGFKLGCEFRHNGATYTQSVDSRGYWLLIEDDTDGDNQTYYIIEGVLVHTDTGVEI